MIQAILYFWAKRKEYGNNFQVRHVKSFYTVGLLGLEQNCPKKSWQAIDDKKKSYFAKPQIPDQCSLIGIGILKNFKKSKLIFNSCQLSISFLLNLKDVGERNFLSKNLFWCKEKQENKVEPLVSTCLIILWFLYMNIFWFRLTWN